MTNPRSKALLALILLVPAPSIGTACGMWLFPGPVGQIIYALCKVWLLGFPLVWLRFVEKKGWSWSPPRSGGLFTGLLLGLVMGAGILAGWKFLGSRLANLEYLRQIAERNGFGTPSRYLALAFYLTFFNSLLEEYVWRWFVFRRSEEFAGSRPAVFLSALLFMIHHTVALSIQFGWVITFLGSLGVVLAALIWSACYLRYRSIWPGFISHIFADAAIFTAGWWMLFG